MSQRIAVVGLWHLGLVTAAVMAEAGHEVTAFDLAAIVEPIDRGDFPIAEPGLAELWHVQREAGRLRTTASLDDIADHPFIWICYDTPLGANDLPDTASVRTRIEAVVAALKAPATVAISSQLPVGSVRSLEAWAERERRTDIGFASIPENLRLGSALAYLRAPDRFVVGVRGDVDRGRIESVLAPLRAPVAWMRVESAEMTKHALNAYLATSVVFANEVAAIAERIGADAREIEEGLKSDTRIGRGAYLRAGEAFAGGTLARDVHFLIELGRDLHADPRQVFATQASNEEHKGWVDRSISEALRGTTSPRVAVLGLTYKPNTNTLRSSSAVALIHRLVHGGVDVIAFDPAVSATDSALAGVPMLAESVDDALRDADVAVVMTPLPHFRDISEGSWARMRARRLIDPQRFLEASAAPFVAEYVSFGRGQSAIR